METGLGVCLCWQESDAPVRSDHREPYQTNCNKRISLVAQRQGHYVTTAVNFVLRYESSLRICVYRVLGDSSPRLLLGEAGAAGEHDRLTRHTDEDLAEKMKDR